MDQITNEEWIQFLTELHADPDFWCDYDPTEFGFEIKDEDYEI